MRASIWRILVPLVILGLASAACGGPAASPTTAADTATRKTTAQGLYSVRFTSRLDPIRINETHAWTLHVETSAGKPVDNAQITVDGGMPAHGHGLPTQPKVTQNLGKGDYLVEGMRFNMPGAWIVTFVISVGGQSDKVTFDLRL
jgi:hypothetical protein